MSKLKTGTWLVRSPGPAGVEALEALEALEGWPEFLRSPPNQAPRPPGTKEHSPTGSGNPSRATLRHTSSWFRYLSNAAESVTLGGRLRFPHTILSSHLSSITRALEGDLALAAYLLLP